MSEAGLRQQVVETVRRMNGLGINQGTSGNASIRHADGMLITPSGMPYEAMAPEDVVFVRLTDGECRARDGLKPSSEWRFHLDIYKQRRSAKAIVIVRGRRLEAVA